MNESELIEEEEYADEFSLAYDAEHGGGDSGCLGCGGTILSGFAFLLLAAVVLTW